MQDIQLVDYNQDGPCCKLRFRLEDGLHVETVFHYPDWVCVSTQAGCPSACVFCEAGVKNFKRNLTRSEIIAQVIVSEQIGSLFSATNSEHSSTLAPSGNRFQTISFSGMGEPLLNFDEMSGAMESLYARGFPTIHISTIGILPRLQDLFALPIPFRLNISLQATTDVTRSTLIPCEHNYPINHILRTAFELNEVRNALLTLSCTLIEGVNDTNEDLRRLIEMCSGQKVIIELNTLNPLVDSTLSPVGAQAIVQFKNALLANGIAAYINLQEGLNIRAGLGQLGPDDIINDESCNERLYSIEAVTKNELPLPKGILLLSLATACGCDCVFCGLPESKRHSVLKPELLIAAIEGHQPGHPWQEINITGGDPLIIPEARRLFPLLAERRAHFAQISVCTAGIPSKQASCGLTELSEAVNNLYLYVSLDGIGELHDKIRRRQGAFKEVEKFVAEARLKTGNLFFHCVVNRLNVSALDEIANYSENTGIPIVYGLVNVSDHYIDNQNRYEGVELSPSQVELAADFFQRRYPQHWYGDLLRPFRGGNRQLPCRLLSRGFLVTSDGTISICGTSKKMVLNENDGASDAASWWSAGVSKRADLLTEGIKTVCQKCSYAY